MSQARKIYSEEQAKGATVDAISQALIATHSTQNSAQDPATSERRRKEAIEILNGDLPLSDLHSDNLSPDEMLKKQREQRAAMVRGLMPDYEPTITMRDPASGWNVQVKESLVSDRLEQGFKRVDREGRAIVDESIPSKDSSLEIDHDAAKNYFAEQRRLLDERMAEFEQKQAAAMAQHVQKPVVEASKEGGTAQ